MSPSLQIRRVGIALAAYEPDVEHLALQLASIQRQTFDDWVCVIASDSPLAPLFARDAIASFRADGRFTWLENRTRLGPKANFEHAIQRVLADHVDAIACADQDDIWDEDKLEVSARALESSGPLSLVHCDLRILHDGAILERTMWQIERRRADRPERWSLFTRNVVSGCAMLFDAALAGLFPNIPAGAPLHDHWYAALASAHGGVHAIARPLLSYRQHRSNVIGIAPFPGTFSLHPYGDLFALLRAARGVWSKAHGLALATRDAGLELSRSERRLFISGADLGAGLLLAGLAHMRDDPLLARACFGAALGKALSAPRPPRRAATFS